MGRSHFLATISAGALIFSSTLFGAEKLDYAKINKNIADVIANSLSQQSNISNLSLRVDGRGTDLEENEFRANFSGTVNSTGWSAEPVTAKGFVKVTVGDKNQGEKAKIELEKSVTINTDVLAMLKFHVKKQAALCQHSLTGIYGVLLKNECEYIQPIEQANNVGDIFAIVKEILDKHTASLETIVAEGNQSIAAISNVALKQEAEKSLQQAKKLLAIVKSAKMEQRKDVYIVAVEDMDFPVLSLLNGLKDLVELDDAKMVMSDHEVTYSGEVDLLAGAQLYHIAKPEIVKYLKGLEEGAEGAKQIVAMKINVMLALLNEKIK